MVIAPMRRLMAADVLKIYAAGMRRGLATSNMG